jgi:hypothetical protein
MRRRTWVILALAVAVPAGVALRLLRNDSLSSAARKTWRDQAMASIKQKAGDPAWVKAETERIRSQPSGSIHDSLSSNEIPNWMSKDLMLMADGSWLVHANICSKEDPKIRDLYLARGSDGRWYFSTMHFCVGMLVAYAQGQPSSIQDFMDAYYVRTFDGTPDNCLEKTLPSGNGSLSLPRPAWQR